MRVWRIFDHRAKWARRPPCSRPLEHSGHAHRLSPSLAVLETLVHVDPTLFGERTLLELDVPETSLGGVSEQALIQLLRDAPEDEPEGSTQRYGSTWAGEMRSLVLEVPSLVMPLERNYLLNPLHPDMKAVKVLRRELVTLDPRLYVQRRRDA